MKNFMFNFKVLIMSLRLHFWFLTMLIFTSVIVYLIIAAATSFITMDMNYFNLYYWNEWGRGAAFTIVTWIVFVKLAIRLKFFE